MTTNVSKASQTTFERGKKAYERTIVGQQVGDII